MHDDFSYIFTYQDTAEKFEIKESQDTLNDILTTIRFIDSNSDFDDTNDSEDEDGDNVDDATN